MNSQTMHASDRSQCIAVSGILRPVFAVAALLLCNFARADTAAQAKAAIQSRLRQRATAYARHNAQLLLSTFSPDYQAVGKNGQRLTFPQLRDLAPAFMRANATTTYSSQIQHVTVKGATAEVVLAEHLVTIGHYSRTGAAYHVTRDTVLRTAWAKGPHGWLEREASTISLRQVQVE